MPRPDPRIPAAAGIRPGAWQRPLLVAAALCLSTVAPGFAPAALAQEVAGPAVEVAEMAGININTASATELAQSLNGVGGSKAEAIIRYREQFGAFESVEELTEVQGIGAAILERNRGMIRIN